MVDKIKLQSTKTYAQAKVIAENFWMLLAGLSTVTLSIWVIYDARQDLGEVVTGLLRLLAGAVAFIVGCTLLTRLLTKKGE